MTVFQAAAYYQVEKSQFWKNSNNFKKLFLLVNIQKRYPKVIEQ